MKENNVLFQIKSLDKMICRTLVKDENINEMETCSKKLNPTPTQIQIVKYILEHVDEEVYQKDLEEVLNLRRATVSGVLQTMEKNNFIERVVSQKDTRTKQIILNENAKQIFLKNKEKLDNLEEVIVKNISKKDLDVFFSVLKVMKDNIKEYNTSV